MKIHRCCIFCLMLPFALFAQNKLLQFPQVTNVNTYIAGIASNTSINADAARKMLAGWSAYPVLKQTGCNYVYYYQDSKIGRIPLRVYVPVSYKNTQKTPCVLQLHGAVSQSKFNDIDSLTDSGEGILTDPLKAGNYIIIQPLADESKGFTWGGKWRSQGEAYQFNITYQTLTEILAAIKHILNIDDNRVYAFGHSDGADGAIGLAVYKPDQFAGVIAYNTMFKNLFTHDFYISNIQNRPLYEVHSDKDMLRKIALNRQIIDSIKKFDNRIIYKEYTGYEHWDKHLAIDAPYANKFMNGVLRNPYQNTIYLETTQNSPYNTCDWLMITKPDTSRTSASWYHPFEVSFKVFVKSRQQWMQFYYFEPMKSTVVKAKYEDNVFDLQTSAVSEVELKISPEMIDLNKPIVIVINGRRAFNAKVTADKQFMLNNFKQNFDRQALWVNSIKVKVD